MDLDQLVQAARDARNNAYAPYSRFLVGAAVWSKMGRIYVGCNVENASFGATICAERVAVGAMVAAGERELLGVAVVVDAETVPTPCGICRQVLGEFARDATVVVVSRSRRWDFSLAELLPQRFTLNGTGAR